MQKGKTNLAAFNNDWYHPGASVVKRTLWFFVNALFFVSYCPFNKLKIILLKLFGARVGEGLVIKPSVNIKYPWKLTIGNHVWIGEKVWIDNLADVTIGDNVCLSQGAMLLTGNHNYKKTTFDLTTDEIVLENGVWIGAKSIVCPGVICKSHAVLSVASVATKSLEAYSIYRGNPAEKIKERVVG